MFEDLYLHKVRASELHRDAAQYRLGQEARAARRARARAARSERRAQAGPAQAAPAHYEPRHAEPRHAGHAALAVDERPAPAAPVAEPVAAGAVPAEATAGR